MSADVRASDEAFTRPDRDDAESDKEHKTTRRNAYSGRDGIVTQEARPLERSRGVRWLRTEPSASEVTEAMPTIEAGGKEYSGDKLYREEAVLRELYINRGLSKRAIANRLGCYQGTVRRWMEDHEIESRSQSEVVKKALLKQPAPFRLSTRGYEAWNTIVRRNGEPKNRCVKHHRLLAVAEYGFDAVCDMDVHHKNNLSWDNRPENLEVLSPSEHRKKHSEPSFSWLEVLAAREMHRNTDSTQDDIAEIFDAGCSTAHRAIKGVGNYNFGELGDALAGGRQ